MGRAEGCGKGQFKFHPVSPTCDSWKLWILDALPPLCRGAPPRRLLSRYRSAMAHGLQRALERVHGTDWGLSTRSVDRAQTPDSAVGKGVAKAASRC